MNKNEMIRFEVPIHIHAQADDKDEKGLLKPAKFEMQAYNGDKMNVSRWSTPVVIDLAGLRADSQQIPILIQHNSSIEGVAGQSSEVRISEAGVQAKGELYRTDETVNRIVLKAIQGYKWQASVGVMPESIEEIQDGINIKVNGREFKGPVDVVRTGVLRENSIVVFGANTNETAVQIAAKEKENQNKNENKTQNEENQMSKENTQAVEPEKTVPVVQAAAVENNAIDAVAKMREDASREYERISKISALEATSKEAVELKAKAIKDGTTVESAELSILKADRPAAPGVFIQAEKNVNAKVLEAQALLRFVPKFRSQIEKKYDVQTLEAADSLGHLSLKGLIQACLRMEGKFAPSINANPNEWVQAGFSTTSLSGILSNIANKMMELPFATSPDFTSILKIFRERNLSDLKTHTMYRMQTAGKLPKVPGGGPLELDSLTESSKTIKAYTHGKLIGITREMLINDDLGAFLDLPMIMGRDALEQFVDEAVALIEGNAGSFFDAANSNVGSGTISATGYAAMEVLFAAMVDAAGKKLGLDCRYVVVPAALNALAKGMYSSTELLAIQKNKDATSNVQIGNANPYAGSFEPVKINRLASASTWYGVADPMAAPAFNVGFLNGQRTPMTEEVTASTDPKYLGRFWRILWDFGFAFGDTQGAVKMN